MTTKTRTPGYVKAEQELDKLIAEHNAETAQNDAAYAPVYTPSEMPELEDMTQQAELPPKLKWARDAGEPPPGYVVDDTVYGVNEELGGDLEYDVDAEGRVQNPRRQPPEAKGDEADLGPLTLEAYWEKARMALDLRDIALSDKARATSSKKAYDDAAKIVDQLGRQIREFGGFGARPKVEAKPATLFDGKQEAEAADQAQRDADYRYVMGEDRPDAEASE